MTKIGMEELKRAVEAEHGGTATFVQEILIQESHAGQATWSGTVHVFNLADHPQTTRAYAWVDRPEDGRQRYFAVLERETITSPRDAVRAVLSRRATRDADDPRQPGDKNSTERTPLVRQPSETTMTSQTSNIAAEKSTSSERAELAQLGISVFTVEQFHYKTFRYTNVRDAIAQAQRDASA